MVISPQLEQWGSHEDKIGGSRNPTQHRDRDGQRQPRQGPGRTPSRSRHRVQELLRRVLLCSVRTDRAGNSPARPVSADLGIPRASQEQRVARVGGYCNPCIRRIRWSR